MDYKRKNILLLLGFLVMLIISYQFAIKRTIEVKELTIQQQKELNLLSNAGDKISFYTSQNKVYDSILKSMEVTVQNSYEQTLLNVVTKYASQKGLQIVSFDKPHVFKDRDYEIKTYSISVKGKFQKLFEFHKTIEKERLGNLISVRFEKKRNYQRRRDEVYCLLKIQKIES